MNVERHFVVVKEIARTKLERAVFADLHSAADYYQEAAAAVGAGSSGDGSEDDRPKVTAAALYAVDTGDPEVAEVWVTFGRGVHLEGDNVR